MAALAGCDRDEPIAFYNVPKEPPPATQAAAQLPPPIQWTVPPDWRPLPPTDMRYAAFAVSAQDPSLVLTVIPLGTGSGSLLQNVNRWEAQLGLPATAADQLHAVARPIAAGDVPGHMVDLLGPETVAPRQRILGAIIPHGQRVWFFKLHGPAEQVAAQREAFDAFIGSVRFSHSTP